MRAIRDRWWREQFSPGPWGWLINPFYFSRRGLMRELRDLFPQLKGRLLDVGCGRKPYRDYVTASEYVGLEFDTPVSRGLGVADVYYEGGRLPFADGSFDSVLCSQVLEHVFSPAAFVAELSRVVRPGGVLVLTVPFVWDEHEQPFDYGRYTSFGLRALLGEAGFEVREFRKSSADAGALAQLGVGWAYKKTRTRFRSLNLLVQVAVLAPLSAVGVVFAFCLPRNPDFYLDNVVLAVRLPPPIKGRP